MFLVEEGVANTMLLTRIEVFGDLKQFVEHDHEAVHVERSLDGFGGAMWLYVVEERLGAVDSVVLQLQFLLEGRLVDVLEGHVQQVMFGVLAHRDA